MPYTNRNGTDIAAGQGARAWVELEVMRGVLLDEGADSCELVLFMLTVLLSCEGHHAGVPRPVPILLRSVIPHTH
jgi:hypothetical protein